MNTKKMLPLFVLVPVVVVLGVALGVRQRWRNVGIRPDQNG